MIASRRAKLVCGCFSQDPAKSKITGMQYGLQRNRIYKKYFISYINIKTSYEQMFQHESELPESERMNFVVIATPTATHYTIALLALEVSIDVLYNHSIISMSCVNHRFALLKTRLIN